jgi:outer membrane lipoprotein-sorting protein
MKKLTLVFSGLLLFTFMNAQSLDDIVKKYSAATKQDKISSLTTIKITAKMSMMGMEMPMEMWMKNPNKIKVVQHISGQEIISTFDGEKGYSMNAMTGVVELPLEQAKQTQNANLFQNSIAVYQKKGQLSLEGEEKVNDKPAFKIKANLEGGSTVYMFIDKASYFLLKSSGSVNQAGQVIAVDTYPSDYTETNGFILPMKTTSSMGGMQVITTIEKVEVNIPIEDSIFKLK